MDRPGKGGNHSSDCPSVSADGNRVAFWSYANDIVGGVDPSGVWNIYVYDATMSPHTQRASSNVSGVAQDLGSNGTSAITCPAISGDGRFVAFASGSGNLVADDHNGISDMFLKDLSSGEVRRLSVAGYGRRGEWAIDRTTGDLGDRQQRRVLHRRGQPRSRERLRWPAYRRPRLGVGSDHRPDHCLERW